MSPNQSQLPHNRLQKFIVKWVKCSFFLWCAHYLHLTCARATLSSLVVARCSFWCCSRNPLSTLCTLGASEPSGCGAVLILRLLAQPSRHFGRIRALSLRRGADSVQEILHRGLDKEILYRDRVQGFFTKTLRRHLLQRSCQEVSYRDLTKRSLTETSCTKILYGGLSQRSY